MSPSPPLSPANSLLSSPTPLVQRIFNDEFRNLTVKPPSPKNKDEVVEKKYKDAELAKSLAFKQALEEEFIPKDILPKIKTLVLKEIFERSVDTGGASQIEAMEAYKDFAEVLIAQIQG